MMLKISALLCGILTITSKAQDTLPTQSTTNTTGYSDLCQSCVAFLEQLPGFLENYSPVYGIDANTLCTTLSQHMRSVGDPCFKLFAEYWPNGVNATTLQICGSLYFC